MSHPLRSLSFTFTLSLFSLFALAACGDDTPVDNDDSGVIDDAGPRPDADADVIDREEPCEIDNGGCDPLTACASTDGVVSCGACPEGYAGSGDEGCEDIDECAEGDPCFVEGTCENTSGSFICAPCPEPLIGDGIECVADPCEEQSVCSGVYGLVEYEYACVPLFPEAGFTCRGQFPDWRVTDEARYDADRFEILSEALVRDRLTGLVWQRYAPPESERTPTYANALRYCEGLVLDGESGFRLPEIAELESLIDERHSPAIDESVFPNRIRTLHWSATKSVISPNISDGEDGIIREPSGWTVRFDPGVSRITPLTTNAVVRCVR